MTSGQVGQVTRGHLALRLGHADTRTHAEAGCAHAAPQPPLTLHPVEQEQLQPDKARDLGALHRLNLVLAVPEGLGVHNLLRVLALAMGGAVVMRMRW